MKQFFSLLSVLGLAACFSAMAQEPLQAPSLPLQPRHNLQSVRPATAFQIATPMQEEATTQAVASRGEGDVITEAEGTEVLYFTEGGAIAFNSYTDVIEEKVIVAASKITYGADNKVYLLNPIKACPTNAYIEGTIQDDKIVCQLPQLIRYRTLADYDPETYEQIFFHVEEYASIMVYDAENDSYEMVKENNQAVWSIAKDGTITLDLDTNAPGIADNGDFIAPEYILGVWAQDDLWFEEGWEGYGDYSQSLTPVTLPEIPAGVELSDWSLAPVSEEWYYDFGVPTKMQVGFDGDVAYVKGACSWDPECVMKGEIKEGILTFPAIQAIGFEPKNNAIIYSHTTLLENQGGNFVATDDAELTLQLDMEKNTFRSTKEQVLWFTGHPVEMLYFGYYVNPKFVENTLENLCAAPNAPEYMNGTDVTPTMGYLLTWIIPNINENGCVLDKENMYYNYYINDELFTFKKDVYFNLPEDYTDVSMTYDDKGLFIFQSNYIIDYYGFWLMFENYPIYTMGIQTFYNAPDGNTYSSPLDMINPGFYEPDALPSASIEKAEVASEVYYNLSGMQVANPASGMYIRITTFADGSTKAEKVMHK